MGRTLQMILRPQASTRELERFSYRLGVNLQAGIDLRKALRLEAGSQYRPVMRQHLEHILKRVCDGSPLHEALRECDNFFPPLFVELVAVGELTGRLPETLSELSAYYREVKSRTRAFLSVIWFPLIELFLAIVIIGLFILIFGELTASRGIDADPLGFGLKGRWGLVQYVFTLVIIGGLIYLAVRAFRAGIQWIWPLQQLVASIPVLGSAWETLVLARASWALARTLGSGMDVYQAVRLSIRSTNHGPYLARLKSILNSVRQGQSLAEAFRSSGVFPDYFVESIANGEMAGQLPEVMEHLSKQLYEQAYHSWKQLAIVAGWLIWALIALVIITMIFRLAFFYVGTLHGV